MAIADYIAEIQMDSSKAIRELSKFDSKAMNSAAKAEGSFSKMSSGIKTKIAAGIASISFAGIVKEAAKIEQGFIGVQKTTGLADKNIKKLRDSLLEFSSKSNISTDGLVQYATVAGQLGITGTQNIEKFTQVLAKLEVASDRTVSGELGAQAFAKFLDATGAGVEKAEQMASAITALGNTSKFTEGQLLNVVREVSKVAGGFNVSSEAVLGMSAAFQELSIAPEVARTTSLKFFAQLDEAVRGVNDGANLERFAKITGLATDKIKELQKTTPEVVLTKFVEGLGRIKEEGGSVLDEIDNLNIKGTIMGATFLSLANSGDKMAQKIQFATQAAKENVALNAEFDAANKGVNAGLQKLKNSFTQLTVALGDSGLLGAVSKALDVLTSAVGRVSQFADDIRESGVAEATAKLIADMGESLISILPKAAQDTAAAMKLAFSQGDYVSGVAAAFSGIGELFFNIAKIAAKAFRDGFTALIKDLVPKIDISGGIKLSGDLNKVAEQFQKKVEKKGFFAAALDTAKSTFTSDGKDNRSISQRFTDYSNSAGKIQSPLARGDNTTPTVNNSSNASSVTTNNVNVSVGTSGSSALQTGQVVGETVAYKLNMVGR